MDWTKSSYIGIISLKFALSFSGFGADQWRIWTMVYFPFALLDLPVPIWANGLLLLPPVMCCAVMCTEWWWALECPLSQMVDRSYGDKVHVDTISLSPPPPVWRSSGFGPICGFWLHGFERYINGCLGSYKMNRQGRVTNYEKALEGTVAWSQYSVASWYLDDFCTIYI